MISEHTDYRKLNLTPCLNIVLILTHMWLRSRKTLECWWGRRLWEPARCSTRPGGSGRSYPDSHGGNRRPSTSQWPLRWPCRCWRIKWCGRTESETRGRTGARTRDRGNRRSYGRTPWCRTRCGSCRWPPELEIEIENKIFMNLDFLLHRPVQSVVMNEYWSTRLTTHGR